MTPELLLALVFLAGLGIGWVIHEIQDFWRDMDEIARRDS